MRGRGGKTATHPSVRDVLDVEVNGGLLRLAPFHLGQESLDRIDIAVHYCFE
jgi:hypothetical protein